MTPDLHSDSDALDRSIHRLRTLLAGVLPEDGSRPVAPGIVGVRRTAPYEVSVHGLHKPAICIVAQGTKRVYLRDEEYDYHAQQMLVFAVDLPVASRVVHASTAKPFLGVRIELDPVQIATLVPQIYRDRIPVHTQPRGIAVTPSDSSLIETVIRLVLANQSSEDARLYGPLYTTEFYLRVLRSPLGPMVAQLGYVESRMARISTAIAYIQSQYTASIDMRLAADLVAMSLSSFHHHFKQATAMSPLQYQKTLRLQEARRLLVTTDTDSQQVADAVGYRSVSQFTREYSRMYGTSPMRDAARLRALERNP